MPPNKVSELTDVFLIDIFPEILVFRVQFFRQVVSPGVDQRLSQLIDL